MDGQHSQGSFEWSKNTPDEYRDIMKHLARCVNGKTLQIPSSSELLKRKTTQLGSHFPLLLGGDSSSSCRLAIQAYVDGGATHTFINQPAVDLILQHQDKNDPVLYLEQAPKNLKCHISADGSITTPITQIGVLTGRCLWQEGQFLMAHQQVIVIPGKEPIIILGQDAQEAWGINSPGKQLAEIIENKQQGEEKVTPTKGEHHTTNRQDLKLQQAEVREVYEPTNNEAAQPAISNEAAVAQRIAGITDGITMFGECMPSIHSSIDMVFLPTQRQNYITLRAVNSCRPGTFKIQTTPVAPARFDDKYHEFLGRQELTCKDEAIADVRVTLKSGESFVHENVTFKILQNAPKKACFIGAEIYEKTDAEQTFGHELPGVEFPSEQEHNKRVKHAIEDLLNRTYNNLRNTKLYKNESEFQTIWKLTKAIIQKADENGTFAVNLQAGQTMNIPPQKIFPKPGAKKPPYPGLRVKDPAALAAMKEYIDALVEADIIEKLPEDANQDDIWLSAPNMVKKPGPPREKEIDNYRFTLDEVQVNARQIRTPAATNDPRELSLYFNGSKVYSILDKLSGYFQVPLAEESRYMFCMLTRWGVYRWKRVTQGGLNSAGFYQSAITNIFQHMFYHKMNGVANYMDDFLIYTSTLHQHTQILKEFFETCKTSNIKLSPKKIELFKTSIKFLGREVSKDGFRVCPERISAIANMGNLKTGGDVMQLVCGMRWFSEHIPSFAQIVQPLQTWLTDSLKNAKKRNKQTAKKIPLVRENGWSKHQKDTVEILKKATTNSILLSHVNYEYVKCAHTDASDHHWSLVITQCHIDELKKPRHLQKHEILAAISGSFTGSQLNWSMVDKEHYPMLKIIDYDYLSPTKTWYIFTDSAVVVAMHRMLNSTGVPVGKAARSRRYRWLAMLSLFVLITVHVPGIENWIPDLLTRAGAPNEIPDLIPINEDPNWNGPKLMALRLEGPEPSNELHGSECNASKHDIHFPCRRVLPEEWPTIEQICQAHTKVSDETIKEYKLNKSENGLLTTSENLIWIPQKDPDLLYRIVAIAHQASAGHRGVEATMENIRKKFDTANLKKKVMQIIKYCLQCMKMFEIKDGLIPRPFGSTLIAQFPGDVVYGDYVWIYDSYLLVLVDGFTRFIWLFHTESADAYTMANAIISIYDIFDIRNLVTDQGSHFNNELCKTVCETLNIQQAFTTAYMPWTNPAERANRELTKIIPKLRSEFKVPEHEWSSLIPVVKYSLNSTLRPILKMTPAEALTGAPHRRTSQFCALRGLTGKPKTIKFNDISMKFIADCLKNYREKLHDARGNIFRLSKERHDKNNKYRKKAILPRIELGDYVLVATRVTGPKPLRSNKIRVKWQGPMVVVNTVTKWIVEVQFIGPQNKDDEPLEIHVNRLRRYSDKYLNVTEDLIESANEDAGNMVPLRIISHRFEKKNRKAQLLFQIEWRGYPDEEDFTWEIARQFAEDCRIMSKKYIEKQLKSTLRSNQRRDLKRSLDLIKGVKASSKKHKRFA